MFYRHGMGTVNYCFPPHVEFMTSPYLKLAEGRLVEGLHTFARINVIIEGEGITNVVHKRYNMINRAFFEKI